MAEIISITEEEILGQDFNPLAEEVVINFNTPPPKNTSGKPLEEKPLPEADMFGGTQPKTETNNGGSTTTSSKFNQEFDNLPEDEQEEGSEQTADLVIFGYSQLKMLLPKSISISDKQLQKKEKAGEINLSIPFRRSPTDNRPITIGQMVTQFNESIIKPFETSQEFKDSVRPILISIFKKKGVALSPEHLLMILVAQDIIGTGINAARCMADRREILNDLKDLKDEYANANKAKPTQQTAQTFTNRSEPDEPKVNINSDNIQTFEASQQDKKEAAITVTEISKKMVDREEKKAERKKREKKVTTPKVRKQRVVVKAADVRTQQN